MRFSTAGLNLLKKSEGFRNRAYRDAAGFPTIGYGHRLLNPESFPNGIDEAQATEILVTDVRDAEQAVQRLVKVPLTQGQFDALVDFCFNLGAGRLAASTLLKCLNAGRLDDAVEELLRWDRTGKRQVGALKARREAEAKLWRAAQAGQPEALGLSLR
jgi:lysozyme